MCFQCVPLSSGWVQVHIQTSNSICSLQQFIEDRVYDDDGDPTSTDGDGAVQRQKLSREEAEAEFAVKASVALQAGQKFLTENFDQIRVRHF